MFDAASSNHTPQELLRSGRKPQTLRLFCCNVGLRAHQRWRCYSRRVQ